MSCISVPCAPRTLALQFPADAMLCPSEHRAGARLSVPDCWVWAGPNLHAVIVWNCTQARALFWLCPAITTFMPFLITFFQWLQGLSVKAVKGDAVLFYALQANGSTDLSSEHGSCPVIKARPLSCDPPLAGMTALQNNTSVSAC